MSVSDDAMNAATAVVHAASAVALATVGLTTEIANLQAVIVEQANAIAAQAARIAELEAIIDPPPPPPAPTMLVGASVQRRAGETWVTSLARFEESIGKRTQVVRRFDGDAPGDFATTSTFADLTGRHRILSFKGQPTQAQIEAFIRTIPVDGCRTYLSSWHEPEDNMTGATFQGHSAKLLAAIQAVGRTDVIPSIVVKTWLERDGNVATSSRDYFPADPSLWVLLMDPYFSKPENTYASQCGQTVALWRGLGGTRIGIAEFGVKTTGQEAADQITAILTDAAADGCEVASYFDSNVGDNAGAGWYLDLRGPAAQAAFAGAIR